jgi:hypothetical protein
MPYGAPAPRTRAIVTRKIWPVGVAVTNRVLGSAPRCTLADGLERVQPHRQLEVGATEAGGILLGYRRGEQPPCRRPTVPAGDLRSRLGFMRRFEDRFGSSSTTEASAPACSFTADNRFARPSGCHVALT